MKPDDRMSGAGETHPGVGPALRRIDTYLNDTLDVDVDAALADLRERAGAGGLPLPPTQRAERQDRAGLADAGGAGRGRRWPAAAGHHAAPSPPRRHRWASVKLHRRLAVAAAAFAMAGVLALGALTFSLWRSTPPEVLALAFAGGGGVVLAAAAVRTLGNVLVTWMKARTSPVDVTVRWAGDAEFNLAAEDVLGLSSDGVARLLDDLTNRLGLPPGTGSGESGRDAEQPRSSPAEEHRGAETTHANRVARHEDILLTPAEVATMFRVDPKTVTRWAKAGKLTSIRAVGGHRRYREADVRALLGRDPATRSIPQD